MLRRLDGDVVIQVISLRTRRNRYRRILVDESMRTLLEKKCIGEIRLLKQFGEGLATPENLKKEPSSAPNEPPKLWEDFLTSGIGTQEQLGSQEASMLASSRTPKATGLHGLASQMPQGQAQNTIRVRSWRENVPVAANPNEITVEPPQDMMHAARSGRQRRVKVDDSDDDDEVNVEAATEKAHGVPSAIEATRKEEIVGTEPLIIDPLYYGDIAKASAESDSGDPNKSSEECPSAPESQPRESTLQQHLTRPPKQNTQAFSKIGRRIRRAKSDSSNSSDNGDIAPRVQTKSQVRPAAQTVPKLPKLATNVSLNLTNNPFSIFAQDPYPESQGSSGGAQDNVDSPAPPSEKSASPTGEPSNPDCFDVDAYGARTRANIQKLRGQQALQRSRGHGTALQPSLAQVEQEQSVVDGEEQWKTVSYSGGRSRGQARGRILRPGGSRGQHQANTSGRGAHGLSGAQNTLRSLPRHRGSSRGHSNNSDGRFGLSFGEALVDIGSSVSTSTAIPPPGFDIRVDSSAAAPQEPGHLLDEPMSDIHRSFPSHTPPSQDFLLGAEPPRSVLTTRAARISDEEMRTGANYISTHNPGPNIRAMYTERIEELIAEKAKVSKQNEGMTRDMPSRKKTPLDRTQDDDEVSSRTFRCTMEQKAPKPGKKAKPMRAQESRKEQEARIAKAKFDAYGEIPAKKPSPRPSSSDEPDISSISKTKREILKKNAMMAATDPDTAENELRISQTKVLTESLSPLFDAARAFSGSLEFELQFGQVLLPLLSSPGVPRNLSVKEWNRTFRAQFGNQPLTTFTNLITTNGADVDHILQMKAPNGSGNRLWNVSAQGPTTVTYEFQCHTKHNEVFWIVVDGSGRHEIKATTTTVGMVNLHFPGQIWDACAKLSGILNHEVSSAVAEAAQRFVQGLYVPAGQKSVTITYRLPDNNEMMVGNLLLKRKSLHVCQVNGKEDFRLQITEVQTPCHRFHTRDKKLGQAYTKDYSQMVGEERIHYEVSLIHQTMNDLLEQNKDLELGELTDNWTEETVLEGTRMQDFVDLASHIVSKMDGVGACNIGTLYRRELQRDADAQAGQLGVDPETTSRLSQWAEGSNVRGVRGGKAEIIWDGETPYLLGLGGARVPLAIAGMEWGSVAGGLGVVEEESIMPEDSASQVGGPTGGPSTSARLGMGGGLGRGEEGRDARGMGKGPGFW